MGPHKNSRRSAGPCYGLPADFKDTGSLYTLNDVLSGIAFKKLKNPDLSENKIYDIVDKIVRQKFILANPALPLISPDSVKRKIQRALESVQQLEHKKLKAVKKKNLLESLDRLFDLVTCQCEIIDCEVEDHNCSGAHVICSCEEKLPDMEAAWLKDQRNKIGTTGGKYMMGGIDKEEALRFEENAQEEAKKNS